MLEFWFNKQVPTFKKLMILIITLLICIGLYQYQPLPLDTILMFTGTGVIFLICRYLNCILLKVTQPVYFTVYLHGFLSPFYLYLFCENHA
jgi:hypothetical protein